MGDVTLSWTSSHIQSMLFTFTESMRRLIVKQYCKTKIWCTIFVCDAHKGKHLEIINLANMICMVVSRCFWGGACLIYTAGDSVMRDEKQWRVEGSRVIEILNQFMVTLKENKRFLFTALLNGCWGLSHDTPEGFSYSTSAIEFACSYSKTLTTQEFHKLCSVWVENRLIEYSPELGNTRQLI